MYANLIIRHKTDGRILQFYELSNLEPSYVQDRVQVLLNAYRGEATIDTSQIEAARAAWLRSQEVVVSFARARGGRMGVGDGQSSTTRSAVRRADEHRNTD